MPPVAYGAPTPGTPGTVIAGFICAIVGCFIAGPLLWIPGLILCIMGRNQARRQGTPTALATAGFWVSIAGLIISALIIILYIIMFAAIGASGGFDPTTSLVVPSFFV